MDLETLKLVEDWKAFKHGEARIYLEPSSSVPPRLVVDNGLGEGPVMVTMSKKSLRALALQILHQVGTE